MSGETLVGLSAIEIVDEDDGISLLCWGMAGGDRGGGMEGGGREGRKEEGGRVERKQKRVRMEGN